MAEELITSSEGTFSYVPPSTEKKEGSVVSQLLLLVVGGALTLVGSSFTTWQQHTHTRNEELLRIQLDADKSVRDLLYAHKVVAIRWMALWASPGTIDARGLRELALDVEFKRLQAANKIDSVLIHERDETRRKAIEGFRSALMESDDDLVTDFMRLVVSLGDSARLVIRSDGSKIDHEVFANAEAVEPIYAQSVIAHDRDIAVRAWEASQESLNYLEAQSRSVLLGQAITDKELKRGLPKSPPPSLDD